MASKQDDARTLGEMQEEIETLVNASLKQAAGILDRLVDTRDPMPAFVTLTLAAAVLAKSMDIPRDAFLEGVAAAFDSVEEVPHGHAH